MSTLADRLRELRGASSQSEMAKELGMKQPQWARYESGATAPSVDVLINICRVHACSADWLLGLDTRHSVTAGKGSAVVIGNGNASVTTSNRTSGDTVKCKSCPYKKKLAKLEALISK